MNQKGFANIAFIILVVVLAGVAGYFALLRKFEPVAQQPTSTQTQSTTPTPNQNNLVFTVSPTSGIAPLTVVTSPFDICMFNKIDWGDGASQGFYNAQRTCSVQGKVIDADTHTYAKSGTYIVKLYSGNTAATTATVTVNDTTGVSWKTYKNTRFGVEFKYPSDLPLKEETSHNANSANWPLSSDHLYVRLENNSHWFIFEVNPSPKGAEGFQTYSSKKLVINGKTVEVSLQQDSYQPSSTRGIDLLAIIRGDDTGGDWLTLRLYCKLMTCNQEQMRTTFDNILSTFKFDK